MSIHTNWIAKDGSYHANEHDRDMHNKQQGYCDAKGGYDIKDVEAIGKAMLAMDISTVIACCSVLIGGGLIFLGWALLDNYGYNVTIKLWYFLVALGFGVLLKIIDYFSRPLMVILNSLLGVIFLTVGAIYMFSGNSEGKEEFKMRRATVTFAELVLRGAPSASASANALLTLKQDARLRALGATKDGWVLTQPYDRYGL